MKSKHAFFKNCYIPSTIIEWNKLDQGICNTETYVLFRKHLLSFIRPKQITYSTYITQRE